MHDESSHDHLFQSIPTPSDVLDRLKANQQERSILRRLLKLAREVESRSAGPTI